MIISKTPAIERRHKINLKKVNLSLRRQVAIRFETSG